MQVRRGAAQQNAKWTAERGERPWRSECGLVSGRHQGSRGDGSQLLFGDAAVERSLDGGPGVSDVCWWVVSVAEKVFDELLCMVAGSSSGFKYEWNQVDAGIPFELFLLFTFGHVDVVCESMQVEHDVHVCSFGLSSRLGLVW